MSYSFKFFLFRFISARFVKCRNQKAQRQPRVEVRPRCWSSTQDQKLIALVITSLERKLANMKGLTTPGKWQVTLMVLNHQFVVIDSPSWWWSIERNNEKLLQRNNKLSVIEDYNEGSPRNVPVEEIKQGDWKGTMKGLIEFLHRKEELQTKYDLVLNNCKMFANRVFNEYLVGCGQRNTQFFANSDTSNEELL